MINMICYPKCTKLQDDDDEVVQIIDGEPPLWKEWKEFVENQKYTAKYRGRQKYTVELTMVTIDDFAGVKQISFMYDLYRGEVIKPEYNQFVKDVYMVENISEFEKWLIHKKMDII